MSLYKKTAFELSKMLRNRECSSVEICNSFLEKIKQNESSVEAYITICNDVIEKASEVDKRLASGEQLHALAGIPIALKDNISTRGIKTTCASKMLQNYIPPYDAYVVKKLKDAGMIITGKLNMDEFAMGSSTETSYFKKTHNPYNLNYVSGGSSGGCAAAVMSGEAVLSLGSDTGGSIRQPAGFCGAVGLKPTYGSVSRYGLIAFASSLDQIGTICRNVSDTALLYSLICGYDKMDSTSIQREYPNFHSELSDCNMNGLRIGIPYEYFGENVSEEVRSRIFDAVNILKSVGAEICEISLPSTKYAVNAYYIISSAEASSNLARYDGVRYGYRAKDYNNLSDMYMKTRSQGFGDEVKRRIMLGTFVLSSGYYDKYYKKASNVRSMIKHELNNAFKECDIIVTPTYPTAAFKFGEHKDNFTKLYNNDIFTVPASLAGIPAMSIPCGYSSKGLPIAMQIMGKPFSEMTLLKAAFTFEKLYGKPERMEQAFL